MGCYNDYKWIYNFHPIAGSQHREWEFFIPTIPRRTALEHAVSASRKNIGLSHYHVFLQNRRADCVFVRLALREHTMWPKQHIAARVQDSAYFAKKSETKFPEQYMPDGTQEITSYR